MTTPYMSDAEKRIGRLVDERCNPAVRRAHRARNREVARLRERLDSLSRRHQAQTMVIEGKAGGLTRIHPSTSRELRKQRADTHNSIEQVKKCLRDLGEEA